MRRLAPAVALLALAVPAASHADDQAITLHVLKPKVVFGDSVALRGRVTPAAPGVRVVAERQGAPLAFGRTDSSGLYTIRIKAGKSGTWRTRIAGTQTRSGPVGITVSPQLAIVAGEATAFLGTPVVVQAKPKTSSPVTLTVFRLGKPVAELSVRPGKKTIVPTDATGVFALRADHGASHARARVNATAKTLSYGSSGPEVLALRKRLLALHVHVPGPSLTFGSELYDSVIAFQKARGLARTGTVDATTWAALSNDAIPKPRYKGPTHIEVSKSRQILMIVKDGEVQWYLPVSSGAGGITPVGNFSILWKALATTTWLGPAILYRTMTIHGNVAIHGFPSVPSYPASHGCVRIPIWVADWLYQQSPVGERVFVYE